MEKSCSHWWWQAPVFFTISVVLAFIAISSAFGSSSNKNSIPPSESINQELLYNATRALKKSGFNTTSTYLQISPEFIFSSSSNSATFFAIQDSAISNVSMPSWLRNQLLQYHTVQSKLSMNDLLKHRKGSCFVTSLHEKKIAITRKNVQEKAVEINRVLISHPDLFSGGTISIHGAVGPFASLNPRDFYTGPDLFPSPICNSGLSLVSDAIQSQNMIHWRRIVRVLSSRGFVSFAVGLNSVLAGIIQDYSNLTSATIFAPPDLSVVSLPAPLLAKVIRSHVLPERLTYSNLASLPKKALLRTLIPDQDHHVTAKVKSSKRLAVDGVEIVAPDVYTFKNFVIHGISRAFKVAELPKSSSS